MKRTTIGIDIAKQIFELYVEDGVTQGGERRRLSRKKMLAWFANRPPALVGLEACGGAHYWGRELTKLGHEVRLIAPQYVKPWVQTNKSDVADARAICRAVQEPGMRYVGIARKRSKRCKPSIGSAVVSLPADGAGEPVAWTASGIWGGDATGTRRPSASAGTLLTDERWTPLLRQLLAEQLAELADWDHRLETVTTRIKQESAQQPVCQRLRAFPGIGPLSAPRPSGSNWLGRPISMAGMSRPPWAWCPSIRHRGESTAGGMSKRGDRYLRSY